MVIAFAFNEDTVTPEIIKEHNAVVGFIIAKKCRGKP